MPKGSREGPARSASSPADGRAGSEVRADLQRLRAPRRRVAPAELEPMLAQIAERPFSRKGWIFELKHDGFRLLAARDAGDCRLFYRRGGDATRTFPDVSQALDGLPYDGLVMDGEVVVLDAEGRSSFQSLQKRFQLLRSGDIRQAAHQHPATLFVFDLLALEGHDLRPLPLTERKRLLRQIVPATGAIRFADHIDERGEAFYEEVRKLGLEGIMAKRADSTYRAGRSADWLKLRVDLTCDFVVVGFTPPQGGRSGFGALHLGWHQGGDLVYAGRVGSGFDEAELARVRSTLDGSRREVCPCQGEVPRGPAHSWVEPRIVCEVRYKEWTEEGLLRHPVFLRFRPDKPPEECVRDDAPRGRLQASDQDSRKPFMT